MNSSQLSFPLIPFYTELFVHFACYIILSYQRTKIKHDFNYQCNELREKRQKKKRKKASLNVFEA